MISRSDLPFGSKSEPPLPPPIGRPVREFLLEAQEFDNAEIYGRMEAQAAFVRSDCGVELYTESTVDMDLSVVVHPRNTENNLTLRFGEALENTGRFVLRVLLDERLECGQNLCDRLNELRLVGIFLFDLF